MDGGLHGMLERLRLDNLNEQERRDLLAIFHDETLEYDLKNELFSQLDETEEGQYTKAREEGFKKLWQKIKESEEPPAKKTISLKLVASIAAVLVIGLLLGNVIQFSLLGKSGNHMFTAIAPKGSIAETILPDGTVIFLNAGSEIQFKEDVRHKTREVFLKGEAWFNVEKSKESPFVVHTSFYDVRVMGTEFNVRAYPEDGDVITTLEKGEIKVKSTEDFKMEKSITLAPGEQLVYNKERKSLWVRQVDPAGFSSWKENKLIFINMGLKELIVLLERKYGVEIVVPDKSILNYHYDGTIKNETIIEVLNILQATLPVNYVIRGQEVVIYKK